MGILYRVFLLYYMPLLCVTLVCVLPIQLLGCHSCNKRLSCCQSDLVRLLRPLARIRSRPYSYSRGQRSHVHKVSLADI